MNAQRGILHNLCATIRVLASEAVAPENSKTITKPCGQHRYIKYSTTAPPTDCKASLKVGQARSDKDKSAGSNVFGPSSAKSFRVKIFARFNLYS